MAAYKTTLSVGADVRRILLADADVAGITRKVFPVIIDKAVLPYVLYRRDSLENVPTKAEAPGLDTAHLQIVCFAASYEQSVQLAEAVRHALDGVRSGIIRVCALVDSEELWQDDAYMQQLDFIIKIRTI